MDLKGRKIILTGGVRGLGRCIAQKLVAITASVTVFDHDRTGLDDLQNQHREIKCVECDVSNYSQVAESMAEYFATSGCPDVVINNAGILYSAPLIRISADGIEKHNAAMWDKVLATDLSSVFYVTSFAVERMVATRTKGVIVNISSVSASGNAGQSAYSAAKAGVNALTAVWAKELGALGIRVVAVAPGFSETESTKEALSDSMLRETIKKVPLRRLAKPEEIADGVLHAIQNDFFNGKVLELDGGLVV